MVKVPIVGTRNPTAPATHGSTVKSGVDEGLDLSA